MSEPEEKITQLPEASASISLQEANFVLQCIAVAIKNSDNPLELTGSAEHMKAKFFKAFGEKKDTSNK